MVILSKYVRIQIATLTTVLTAICLGGRDEDVRQKIAIALCASHSPFRFERSLAGEWYESPMGEPENRTN